MMTFEQYISNPLGKGSALVPAAQRELMRARYKVKFDNILLREKGKMDYRLFYNSKDNTYWIYVKVPSEIVKEFYYDTVIKFYADENVKGGGNDLFKYNVKFFSNDPSFVYTYAYVFNQNQLFIEELVSKMSKEALLQPPTQKNPSNSVGYVKSLYFVYLLMQNRNLNKTSIFEKQSEPLNPRFFKENVMTADEKIALREEAGRGVSQRKKIRLNQDEYSKLKKLAGGELSDKVNDRFAVTTSKRVRKITNVNSVKSTKKSKRK